MQELIIMRNEITKGGAPLPLVSLLAKKSAKYVIRDQKVKDIWNQALATIIQLFEDNLEDVEVVMPSLWQLDLKKAAIAKSRDAFCVSLDSYDTMGRYALGVSRHFELGGKTQIGVGNRPGYPPLEQQLQDLKKAACNRPIVVFEDDIFTGGTARIVLDMMKSSGLDVVAFITGLQVSNTKKIYKVPVYAVERYKDGVRDIVDPRDLLFGMPDAGLVTEDQGRLYRAPYCLPYVDVAVRASISPSNAISFSKGVIDLNLTFYEQLQVLLGDVIYVRDLAKPFVDFVSTVYSEWLQHLSIVEFCEYTRIKLKRESQLWMK